MEVLHWEVCRGLIFGPFFFGRVISGLCVVSLRGRGGGGEVGWLRVSGMEGAELMGLKG